MPENNNPEKEKNILQPFDIKRYGFSIFLLAATYLFLLIYADSGMIGSLFFLVFTAPSLFFSIFILRYWEKRTPAFIFSTIINILYIAGLATFYLYNPEMKKIAASDAQGALVYVFLPLYGNGIIIFSSMVLFGIPYGIIRFFKKRYPRN